MLKSKYDCLFGIKCENFKSKGVQKTLLKIGEFINVYYSDVRDGVKECEVKSKISDTLITKILMGTLGCVPAYDRYFIEGIKEQNVSTVKYNLKSLLKLVYFYKMNFENLEEARQRMEVYYLQYPQMKLLDMGFWQIGFEKDTKKGLQIAH